VTEGNDCVIDDNEEEKANLDEEIFQAGINIIEEPADSWYHDLKYLLDTGVTPGNLNLKQRRALRLKATPYKLIQGIFFRSNHDGVLLRCLEKEDSLCLLNELHEGPVGGNFRGIPLLIKF